ncbi:DsbA family oxidoreductase [Actinomadura rugatobispora]|uniref:DsbA family oxidoreductase n=1 Tax=Actinomadura rugatobispora TaxID=1994 RepID=A0ABW1A3V6_9ACTN
MVAIAVDIWTDLVCPWCFIGKRRFEAALGEFEHRDAVEVRWRSFELDPGAPAESTQTIPERIRDLGMSEAQADEQAARVTALAAEVGLAYRLDLARPVNSFDAHRVMHLAEDEGVGEAVRERLMTAYTGEGAALGDHETLVAEAAKAGLDGGTTRTMLKGDAYTAAVRADEQRAAAVGVTAVPSFVGGGKYLVAGAQPAEVFALLLRRVWEEAAT